MTIFDSDVAKQLHAKQIAMRNMHLRELFKADPDRTKKLSLTFGKLYYDFSKQRIDEETVSLLVKLAEEAGVKAYIERMFAGEVINTSEKRQVLHVALRHSGDNFPVGRDVMAEVHATQERLYAFADAIRSGELRGSAGDKIETVVNIGIGGSDLGPKMMAMALRQVSQDGPKVHFVSNLDGAQLASLLPELNPKTTLFILCSKTFTTQETMLNAKTARAWLVKELGEGEHLAKHLAAVSSRPKLAADFGIPAERVFPIWDWVGGRFSLWSAIGLGLLMQIGSEAFKRLLCAAEAMDNHLRTAPLAQNLPVMMALIGIWNTNFMGAESLSVLPYNESMKFFPSFLQQLEMESNGKSTQITGAPTTTATCPIVWGELGNNGQHAFFQLIHQGGRLVPCDFIAAAKADYPLPGHQEALLSNCFAQTRAMAFGKTADEVRESMRAEGKTEAEIEALVTQRTFAGNQPTSTIMMEDLSPESLGALVALYEHKVLVQGILWGVNSFDQWGVELGKAMARQILPKLSGTDNSMQFDSSTEGLIAFTKKYIH